jgi:hypothetical protein
MSTSLYPTETAYARPRIYSYLTGSRFLHLEDALLYKSPKIRFFAGEFKKNQGMKANAFHFLDLDDARVLFSDLAWGKPVDFIDFKGGPSTARTSTAPLRTGAATRVISRVLKIQTKPDKIWIEIHNGPGEVIAGGAVKPKGAPDVSISIPLTAQEARKLGFAVVGYLQAWETVRMWKNMWKVRE